LDRRFITFMLVSFAVLTLFFRVFPPPEQPEKPAPAAGAQADGKQADEEKVADADAAGDQQPASEVPAEGEQPLGPAGPVELPDVADDPSAPQLVTLGSLDMADGYRMLVTFTSRGAAVHRAEMASPRYIDQHNRSGYLGELELGNVPDGIAVGIVGSGTPAAKASPHPIEAGDVIVGVKNGKAGDRLTTKSFNAALRRTRPGRSLTLQVKRGDGQPEERTVKLGRRPFAVLRPEVENFEMRDVPVPDFEDRPSFLLNLSQVNNQTLSNDNAKRLSALLETGNWELAAQDQKSVTFRRELPELNLELLKRYTLEPVPADKRDDPNYPGYHVQLDVELRNTADAPQSLAYRLDGPTGMPVEGWWFAHKISRRRWFGGAGLRDVVVRFDGNPIYQFDCSEIASGDLAPVEHGQALAFAGVDGQYFASMMIPVRKTLQEPWFDKFEAIVAGPVLDPRTDQRLTNVTSRFTRTPLEVAAGETHKDSYQVFIGPKRPNLLANYQAANDPNYSLSGIVYYGLALFGAVARAMLAILHFFYSIVGNYGIAIIMLTVLVRGAMFPLSYKQTKNMARIQALKPEMDRLNEQYKTDMQKRSQAMQELYRKHQINPLGGCLPVFLQLPIFMGLYRALMVDIELRQSPLFGQGVQWCSDLAAPDMLLNWSSFMPAFIVNFLGPYLNILPLVTVVLFLVTQKMSMPEPTNEQAAMQQKMMKYMTVLIGVMFYKVASGLCLYFIASSLWGIGERKLLTMNQESADASGAAAGEPPSFPKRPTTKSGPNGSPRSKDSRKNKRKK
jgi:YidC/Oxa1 family membrane protein insertase